MVKGNAGFSGGGRGAILFLGIAAGIVSAYFLLPGPIGFGLHALGTGETAMNGRSGSDGAQRPQEIPRIDLVEHGATETAIFAMG